MFFLQKLKKEKDTKSSDELLEGALRELEIMQHKARETERMIRQYMLEFRSQNETGKK